MGTEIDLILFNPENWDFNWNAVWNGKNRSGGLSLGCRD